MNGPIAQLVALVCHANAVLQGRRVATFFPANSTCQFCDSVEFIRLKRGWLRTSWRELPLAANPDAWFEHLKASECQAVSVHHGAQNQPGISDRMSAGFVGGGGQWLLQAKRSRSSDYYGATWTVWNQNAPEKRIWRVKYGITAENSPSQTATTANFSALKTELFTVLREIEGFARRQDLAGFADCFKKALECLEAERPFELVYHKDLAPDGLLHRESAQLLAATQAGWVFGGMGSWNDLGFDGSDQNTYELLSDRLFDLANRVICAATNSTARPQTGV